MPPSFGVKYPFAPKLFLNHNYFLQTVASKALHAVVMYMAHQSGIPTPAVGSSYKYVCILFPLFFSTTPRIQAILLSVQELIRSAASELQRIFSDHKRLLQILQMASISEIPQVQ